MKNIIEVRQTFWELLLFYFNIYSVSSLGMLCEVLLKGGINIAVGISLKSLEETLFVEERKNKAAGLFQSCSAYYKQSVKKRFSCGNVNQLRVLVPSLTCILTVDQYQSMMLVTQSTFH